MSVRFSVKNLNAGKVSVRYDFVLGSYDAYAADRDSFVEPDCVCAFNCGFIFYPSWDASIPAMIGTRGVPLVFTEYYLEDCR